jgi:hypothetical protein
VIARAWKASPMSTAVGQDQVSTPQPATRRARA